MAKRRVLPIFLVFFLVSSIIVQALPVSARNWDADLPVQAPLASSGFKAVQPVLEKSDWTGLSVTLDTPDYQVATKSIDSNIFQAIYIGGHTMTAEPGHPQMPMVTALLAVPPEADLEVFVTSERSTILAGSYLISPAPTPRSLQAEQDLQAGEWETRIDQQAYGRDSWYPAETARIGAEAWVRDQRIVRLEFFPFQYNPVRLEVRWNAHLQADIAFGGMPARPLPAPAAPQDPATASSLQGVLLNAASAPGWRMPSGSPAYRNHIQSPIQSLQSIGQRYEIKINQDGIYKLTYADLQAAGMDVDNINPKTFHLYNHGMDVAIYVDGEGDNSFDSGDYLLFFGEKFRGDILAARYESTMTKPVFDPFDQDLAANNWFWKCYSGCDLASYFERYTDDNIYFLTVGGAAGPRMSSVDGTPNNTAPVPETYPQTVRAERGEEWWSHEFYDDEVWFWNRINKTNLTTTYTTTLTAVASGNYTATVHAEMASRTQNISQSPDHHTQAWINNDLTLIEDSYWDGKIRHAFTSPVPQSSLLEGANSLHILLAPDTALPVNTNMYFDFFEITYQREFAAEADQIAFSRSDSGTWQYEIRDFESSSFEILEVSDPHNPIRVLNSVSSPNGGTFDMSFQATDGPSASYMTSGANGIRSPVSITDYDPPDFSSMPEADYIIITHEAFLEEAEPLADYRGAQGYSVATIDIADLYREFNDGIYHPIAIKNFLAYAFANWSNPPTYVVLVGTGHWNFKGDGQAKYGAPPAIFMPPNLAYIDPWQGEVDSANLLATLVGDDTIPDVHIARLPVSSTAEFNTLISKTIAYETAAEQDWNHLIAFVADNVPDPAGDFELLAETIISDYISAEPELSPQRIYESDFGCSVFGSPQCDQVTYAITQTVSTTGTLLLNYIGHASLNFWSGERALVNADIATMNNPAKLPVVLSWTCLDGFWTYPNVPSLVYEFLTSSGKGAVATFSATGLGVATGHDYLQRGFFDSLFGHGNPIISPAALEGKLVLFGTAANLDLLHTFTVFGDPALIIQMPESLVAEPPSYDIALPIVVRP